MHLLKLGIIFLKNPEVGTWTPPLGTNLVLAPCAFNGPVLEITRARPPFLLAPGIMSLGNTDDAGLNLTEPPVRARLPGLQGEIFQKLS
jgi:C4-dicarboxylate transporter DctM subunit